MFENRPTKVSENRRANFRETFLSKIWMNAWKKFDLSTKVGKENMKSGNLETIQNSLKTNSDCFFLEEVSKQKRNKKFENFNLFRLSFFKKTKKLKVHFSQYSSKVQFF